MPPLDIALPSGLVDSVEHHGSPERSAWLTGLAATVREVAEEWGLTLGPPYQPGGQCSWTAPVSTSERDDLVLKVWWVGLYESEHEAAGLSAWDGHGAVRVHRASVIGASHAMVIERCIPGTTLAMRPAYEQDEVISGILRRLWEVSPTEGAFRPLTQMCDTWADAFDRDVAAGGVPGGPADPLTDDLVTVGIGMFRALPRDAATVALLATDLHAENVLAAQREPWLMIDPKPYVGDPAYDPVQHMLNCSDRLFGDPMSLVRRMSELTGVDEDRLARWLFARCVQESIDWPELGRVATALAPAVG